MDDQLDISVIVPMRNVMPELRQHVGALNKWLHKVRQVVIVDSESSDGSAEYIRRHLQHPCRLFLDHPPGLYASWNAAIRAVDSTYTYFATVGDCLKYDALCRLFELAGEHRADVVVSAPELVQGQRVWAPRPWPIHEFLARVGGVGAYELSPLQRVVWNLSSLPGTLIGSSASNLYRTSVLQESPFPCDYGHAGDSAWAVSRPLEDRWLVACDVHSKFIKHPRALRQRGKSSLSRPKLYRLAQRSLRSCRDVLGQEPGADAVIDGLEELLALGLEKAALVEVHQGRRERCLPWFLDVRAIRERRRRISLERLMRRLSSDLRDAVLAER